MCLPRVSVFVSATTNDLGECRTVVRDLLLRHAIFPVVQEHLPPDHSSLLHSLQKHVATCDAVICLVGKVFGAAPSDSGTPPRSYTQLEYDVACQFNKPVFVFLTSDAFSQDASLGQVGELAELQQQHRTALLERHACQWFASAAELSERVISCLPRLRELAGNRPMLYLHPPARPAFFVGRRDELRQLTDALSARFPAVIGVLGMGGQGKTTLLREAIEKLPVFPFATGFWCTAYRVGFSFDNFLDAVLEYLLGDGFDKRRIPEVGARVDRLLTALQEKPTLLVIDGVEHWLRGWSGDHGDLESAETTEQRASHHAGLDAFVQSVAGLSNGSHLVLTTRAIPAALDQLACVIIPLSAPGQPSGLEGLDDEAAVRLLVELGVKGSTERLRDAAQAYSNHPLALEVLAGLLLKSTDGRIESAPSIKVLDAKRRLFQLFDLTRRKLPGRRSAERFLQIAAHFIEDPPLLTLAAAWQERCFPWVCSLGGGFSWRCRARLDQVEPALSDLAVTLADWNLLHWDRTKRIMRLHPLVKAFFIQRTPDSRRIHRQLARSYARESFPEDAESLADVRPRVLAIEHWLRAGRADRSADLVFAAITPVCSFAEWLAAWGHHATGADLLARVAAGLQGIERAELLNVRGALLRELGQTREALITLDEAVALAGQFARRRSLRPQRLVGAVHLNRANARRQLKQFSAAMQDYEQAIGAFERSLRRFPSFLPHLANTLANRANVLRDTGCLSAAIREYAKARAQFDAIAAQGGTRWESLSIRVRLNQAITFADRWDHGHALPAFTSVVAALRELIQRGQTDLTPTLAYAHTTCGMTLSDAGQSAAGLRELDEGIAVLRRLVEAGRHDLDERLAVTLLDRSLARAQAARWLDARADADAAQAIFSRLPGGVRPELQGSVQYTKVLQALGSLGARDGETSPSDCVHRLAELRRLSQQEHLDLRAVHVRASLAIVGLLLNDGDHREWGVRLLRENLTDAEQELRQPEPCEAVLIQWRHSLEQLARVLPGGFLMDAEWQAADAVLRRICELCDDPRSPFNPCA